MKNKYLFILFVCFVIYVDCFSQSAVCSYKYRKRITFDPTKVSGPSDLTNFPVLISITSDNDLRTVGNSGDVENASGFDIVFTSDDGVTLLNFQREKYTATNGQYTAWVRIPTLSTSLNTIIYMYYGNTGIAADQSSTSTWSGYHAVWHFENNSFLDSSPNSYTLTNNATSSLSPAFINDGRSDNGTQWLEVASTFPNVNSNFSISGWAYTNNNSAAGQRIFCDDVNNSGGYALSIGDAGTGQLRFYSRGSSNILLDSPSNTILNNTWHYCVGVADITNGVRKLFIDGVQVATITSTGWSTDAGNASIGGETSAGEAGNRLNGRLDEIRIANTALSADWISTEYNNQSSPSTFYSISGEPKVWNGGTSTNYNTASNWQGSVTPTSGDDVIINNGTNQPTLQSNQQVNSLFIRTGATLSLSNLNLSVRSDISNCGTINGNTGLVTLNSSTAFVQTQNISGSGTYSLFNLAINNTFTTSPTVVLNRSVTVSGALLLVSGIVSTSTTNILALGTGATSTSGSATTFVSGPMSKDGSTAFVFPVGKGTRWRRVRVNNHSATAVFRAEYFNTAFTSTTPVNSPITDVSVLEYWQVDRLSGGNANLSLYWESATGSGIDNCADLTIARWNGASWDERPATIVAGSTCSGTGTGTIMTNAVLTTFSPFTFGSKSTALNPLPVEFIDFKATCESNKVLLEWKTASETNNNHYIIERGTDGINWEDIAHVKAAGTISSNQNYSYSDNFLTNEIVYYKLSQVDIENRKELLQIISANCLLKEEKMSVYPNPASNEINIELDLSQKYKDGLIKVIDNLGKVSLQQKIDLVKGKSVYKIPLNLPSGAYSIMFFSEQLSLPAQKLIVK